MKLESLNIRLENIMLDPENPRSIGEIENSQKKIQEYIMKEPDTTVLLNSMIQQVRWVNSIVVREIKGSNNYIVVEGNTRTACLKTGRVPKYNNNSKIPVLVAVQEENETDEQYDEQIKITQGIANVMSVKEWPAVKKARHLFGMFETKKRANKMKAVNIITKEIADSLGLKSNDVRKSVRSFSFFNQIDIIAVALDNQDFSYLEALVKNSTTRSFFGFNNDEYLFQWELIDNLTEQMEAQKKRLQAVPKLVEISKPKVRALDFRKLLPQLLILEDDSSYFDLVGGKLSWEDVIRGNIYNESESGTSSNGESEDDEQTYQGTSPSKDKDDSHGPDDQDEGTSQKENDHLNLDTNISGDQSGDDGNQTILLEFILWKNKKYVVEHVDTESDIPYYLSIEDRKAFFYTGHPLYKMISKKNHYHTRLVTLLSIDEAYDKSINKEEFKSYIINELIQHWR